MALDRLETIRQASACLQGGDLAQAERLCHALLDVDSGDFEARLLLGMLERQRGHDIEAQRLVNRALQSNQQSPEAFAIHGQLLRALGRHEEALAEYGKALALRPGFADTLYAQGNLLRELERYEEALDCYDRALDATPDDAQVLNNRGVALQQMGRHEEALESCARALALRPGYAEAFNNRGISLQALGLFELALESFDKAMAAKPGDPLALNNRGNALLNLGRFAEALASYELAIRAEPADAQAFSNRGAVLHELGRHDEALASCDRALALRPGFAQALSIRGHALQSLGRDVEALAAHQEAFAIEPGFAAALGIGNALQALQRYEEALASYDRALAITPDRVEALNNRGNSLQALNRHEEALQDYARAIALKPHDAQAHWNEGLARLALGDFARGWEKYEWRWQNHKLDLAPYVDASPAWQGTQDIHGKTVLLYPEQGLGDAIQFIRYAPQVAALGARVHVACHESLCRLFESVQGVAGVVAPGSDLPSFDCHAALMSLPLAFKTVQQTIPAQVPYLFADATQVRGWHGRLDPRRSGLNVGLAWMGNPKFPGARAKSCPVERLAPLLDLQGTCFFSLQKGDAARDAVKLNHHDRQVTDWTPELNDFSNTAALICALDLVITIDTAVAHLAGALGKPVWILLPYAADWRWLRGRNDSPWYPSARLFRQSRIGDWDSVLQNVAQELVAFQRAGPAAPAS
jgi:tetratricopeptide (TPR) repeat protein